ncbi:hypothetical protein [Gilvibacter sediminis]|uniref:hypothetical protein n=1 Tax=Gilvibacter sediminis TaxID=379071 RepID=UPI002350D1C6|nr:hypothetical protein [Gilvibacter sediminis]MDC7998287.1 hypothetical protein [Gilvibacter sediminis]
MAKFKLPSSDRLLSLVAMCMSLITLVIFVRQTNIMEKESHLGVLPYLAIETSDNSQDKQFRIEIINYGVGPAIIESRVIKYKGKRYDMEFPAFLYETFPQMDSIKVLTASTVNQGLAIPAGQARIVMVAGGSQESYEQFLEIMLELEGDDSEFEFEINYKSIFEDRWQLNATEREPIPIDQ